MPYGDKTKGPARIARGPVGILTRFARGLPLGELEAAAGAALAVLLALLHAAVAGEEADAAECDLEIVVVLRQRAGQAHDDGAGLATGAAAGGVDGHVHLPAGVGHLQRAEDRL